MRILTKSAITGLSIFLSIGVLSAQQPIRLNYDLQKIKDVDGSQSVSSSVIQKGHTLSPQNSETPPHVYQPLFITAPLPASKSLAITSDAGARQMAFDFLNSVSARLQISDARQSFSMIRQDRDQLGFNHVKMQQVYQGVPVFGAETIVHLKEGQDGMVNGKCIPESQLSHINTIPTVDDARAQDVALASIKTLTGFTELSADAQKLLHYTRPEKELVIFQDMKDAGKINLAWHFTIRPNALERWEYFVDAHTGSILFKYDNTCTDGPVTGQGTDLKSNTTTLNLYQVGSNYYMIDATKAMFNSSASVMPDNPLGAIRTVSAGNTDLVSIKDLSSTSANSGWTDKSAVSAHYHAGICYDYYLNTFGRSGLDGNGSTMLSVVNVTQAGAAMDNAYWNGQLMAYGNGNVAFNTPLAAALDVTGHEMTHGVIQSTANLIYQDQSGAINESFADIFGCMIERKNWTIGEDIVNKTYFPTGALRDLSNPHNGGSSAASSAWQPSKVAEYVTTTLDHGGVHVNSGIPSFAFYKIATNTSKDSAEKVYYRALTLYLTRSSQFIDLRLAVVQAATDLYGSKSHFIDVAKGAFDAVQIFDGTGNDFQKDLPAVYGTDFLMVHKAPYSDTALYLVKPKSPNYRDYHPMVLNQAINKPSITDDGQRAYFIGTDKNIYKLAVDTLKFKEFLIAFTGHKWNNIAISKDSTKLALTHVPNDTSIWILDMKNASKPAATRYKLFNPTYAAGVNTGGPVYANTLEWDPTGEFVMYDSYNQIGTGSTKINYWDVGFLKAWDNSAKTFGDGTITKLFASLPKGVDVTNPTYSKNSPFIIAYDYYDENTKTYKIYTSNIEHGYDSAIYTNNTFGYPTFSKNDDMLAFTSINKNKDTIIAQVHLHASKMSASGNVSTLLTGYKWPLWYTRGLRKGVEALYNTVDAKTCQNNGNTFYSNSLGKVYSYSWNFGANATPATSTLPGPINVVYSKGGAKTVTLTVKDSTGAATNTYATNLFVYANATLTIAQGANDLLTMSPSLPVSKIQWFFNGKAISGANSASITAVQSGTYTVEAQSSTGCITTSTDFNFVNTGIDENHSFINPEIYPNPNAGNFNLSFQVAGNRDVTLNIYNRLGQNMYCGEIKNASGFIEKNIHIPGLADGVYMMILETGQGMYCQKILIAADRQ